MVNLLIATVLTGLSVTYLIELAELITFSILEVSTLNKYAALPLSFGALYSQVHITRGLIIAVPSATFIAIALSKYLNKPTIINRLGR
jgi:ABC-type phosphate transport system permease subunit